MTIPVKSTNVATNGANALAGSKRISLRTNGSIEPTREAKVTMAMSVQKIVKTIRSQCSL